jgi:signal transduction histidine kinase
LITNSKDELVKKDYNKCIIIQSYIKNENAVIIIKDNAGGIPENIIHKIFEPYFTTKHNSQGTGIGLYMSRNIIKHMHGNISVNNCDIEYNGANFKGASFEIQIPLKKGK